MADERPDDGNGLPPDDGNAAAVAADGTRNEGDGRNAEAEPSNVEKLNKQLQEKAARVNAAEAEASRLRDELDRTRKAQSPAAPASDPRSERRKAVRDFAEGRGLDAPDPVAAEVMDLREELGLTLQELANLRDLDRIPDEGKRTKVKDHFNANRHRLGDVTAARAEIEREELSTALEQERAEKEQLKKALEATSKRQNPDVVRTHVREVPAGETKRMTQAEWDADQKAKENDPKARMASQLARVRGLIEVE